MTTDKRLKNRDKNVEINKKIITKEKRIYIQNIMNFRKLDFKLRLIIKVDLFYSNNKELMMISFSTTGPFSTYYNQIAHKLYIFF